jgi:hypothetical protein
MDDLLARMSENLIARVSGPMKFRLILQPIMASVLAILAGLKDAKAGKPPYFWAMMTDPIHRADMIRDGWKRVGRVFFLALVLDIAYQIVVSRFVYFGEAIIVSCVLAVVPYLILRGPVNRLVRQRRP